MATKFRSIADLKTGDSYWGVYGFKGYFQKEYLYVTVDHGDAVDFVYHGYDGEPRNMFVGPMKRRS